MSEYAALSLEAARRVAFSVVAATIRRTTLMWVLLRLLLAFVSVLSGVSPLGGWRHSITAVLVTAAFVVYDARRLNERVFAENMGISERAVAAIYLLFAVLLEILLLAARLLAGA